MDEHKQKLDKEYEGLMQNFQRELEKLRQKHNAELEKKVIKNSDITIYAIAGIYMIIIHAYFLSATFQNRNAAAYEKRKIRDLQSAHEKELKLFTQMQKKGLPEE